MRRSSIPSLSLGALCLAGLFVLPGEALANGQTTHIWITLHALEHLPEGELKELLTAEANRDALVSGSMFPDGGYAVNDGYGETAHWEPFQLTLLDWIRANQAAPYTDEGERYVAFLLGLSSHGMADQTFDAMYVPKAQQEDEGLQVEGGAGTSTWPRT